MKAYAFVGYFDESIQKTYHQIWQFLSEHGISDYGVKPERRKPHITLADYYDIEETSFTEHLESLYTNSPIIPIELTQLGHFLGTGTLFYAPTISNQLNTLHVLHHKQMKAFETDGSYYLPGSWTPHVTVASRLTHEQMMKSFDYCKRGVIKGRVTALALIEVIIENDVAIGERLVWSKTLKDL